MFKYIFLIQVLFGVMTLANSKSACWMPAKDFSAQDQEPQGKETRHPVHAARRVCPPGKANCEQGIIKWYPEIVKDIKAHKDVQVLTYPQNAVSWISSTNLKGHEQFLIVGRRNGQYMRLCRSIVRTHTVIGEHQEGETSCTVKIRGEAEKRKPFELLVINSHGKSMGMNSIVTECQPEHSKLVMSSSEDSLDDEIDEKYNSGVTADDDKIPVGSKQILKDSSSSDEFPGDKSTKTKKQETGDSPHQYEPIIVYQHHYTFGIDSSDGSNEGQGKSPYPYEPIIVSQPSYTFEIVSSYGSNREQVKSLSSDVHSDSHKHGYHWSSTEHDSEIGSDELSGDQQRHQTQSKLPCWSNFKSGPIKYEGLNPIGVTNRNKLYLVRLTSKGNIRFGTFSPSQGKIVSFDGKHVSLKHQSVQLLNVKLGSLGWKPTTQSVYRWRVPRDALIVGKFAGSPYALSGEPTYYTICRPDMRLGMRNRKLLLGVANSRTGLCTAALGGQVVHFTRFHILTKMDANVYSVNVMETCPRKLPQARRPVYADYW